VKPLVNISVSLKRGIELKFPIFVHSLKFSSRAFVFVRSQFTSFILLRSNHTPKIMSTTKKQKRIDESQENQLSTTTEIDSPVVKKTKSIDDKEIIFLTWNVNGFRAILKKDNGKALQLLVKRYQPLVISLQETKLSDGPDATMKSLFKGYSGYFNISKTKKGYSGTAVYVRDDNKPLKISYDMGIKNHDDEGRLITAEFNDFFLVCAYIPNSGQNLEDLQYRTKEWDPDFFSYLKSLENKKPVILTGDLNCAILDIDVHNPKTCVKSAGFTPEERGEFQKLLDHGFVDSFRKIHPDEKGQFTYWSYRGNSKATNKGWRLDYFLLSQSLSDRLLDCLHITNFEGSDHCPIILKISK